MTLATPEGTRRYADDLDAADGYFRDAGGRTVSSIGMGSYLGEVSEEANRAYEEAAVTALESGVNLLDTAINYRNQQSERDLGRALDRFGRREEVVVVTKGGFLHGDGTTDPQAHVGETYVRPGIVEPDDIVGGVHCLTADFIEHELETSLGNLGVDAVDLYLVHNPETQLENDVEPAVFRERLRSVFEVLEREVREGRVGGYGIATWQGLRLPQDQPGHLPLEQVLDLAGEAAEAVQGDPDDHRFEAVQLPLNLALTEAAVRPTQRWRGSDVTALEAAGDADLTVLTSASLMQGRILGHIREEVRKVLEADQDVEACLEFARSAPGVTTALVGMGSPEHAEMNVALMRDRSPRPERVQALLGS